MKSHFRFIVIDDDLVNNMLCQIVIVASGFEIRTFDIPEIGFEYLIEEYTSNEAVIPTILFLDINMPTWTGWDFLENFDKLDEHIKNQIIIYILSSSVDTKDMERARANRYVADYITKPLNTKIIADIVINQN